MLTLALACLVAAPPGTPLVRAAWGGGPSQLGHVLPDESSPEVPSALALDGELGAGRVVVLDQVNARAVVYGKRGVDAIVRLPSDGVEDIAVLPSGDVVALDRTVRGAVTVLDSAGHTLVEVPLAGDGVEEGGLVTAVLAAEDGVYVEVEHSHTVRVLDAQLRPVREVHPGRPIGGGLYMRAFLLQPWVDRSAVIALENHGGRVVRTLSVAFDAPLMRLVALEKTRAGFVLVGHEVVQSTPGARPEHEALVAVHVDDNGKVLSRVSMPANTEAIPLREIAVDDAGHVALLHVDAKGAEVRRW